MNGTARHSEQRRLLGLRRVVHYSWQIDPACATCKAQSCAGCRKAIVAAMKTK